MTNIHSRDFKDLLDKKMLQEKTPFLGICLGMKIMCCSSEEGNMSGLSWVDADVLKFKFESQGFKIPHMGWNIVTPIYQ